MVATNNRWLVSTWKTTSPNWDVWLSVKHTSDFEDLVHEKNVKYINFKILITWTSLVVQWLKNLPASAGDTGSTSGLGWFHMSRVTKPMPHSYWSLSVLQPVLYRAHAPQQEKAPQREEKCNQRKPVCSNEDTEQPKINELKINTL